MRNVESSDYQDWSGEISVYVSSLGDRAYFAPAPKLSYPRGLSRRSIACPPIIKSSQT
jgi:hypothetical protein